MFVRISERISPRSGLAGSELQIFSDTLQLPSIERVVGPEEHAERASAATKSAGMMFKLLSVSIFDDTRGLLREVDQ